MGYIFDALTKAGDDQPDPNHASGNDSAKGPQVPPASTPVSTPASAAACLPHDGAQSYRFPAAAQNEGTSPAASHGVSGHDAPAATAASGCDAPAAGDTAIASHSAAATSDVPVSYKFPAAIPTECDPRHVDDRLVAMVDPESVMAEEYRSIRTGLMARCEQRRHIVHTITSATPQEGKTLTSLNLGLCFAELRNRRTIVLECDLRLPQFARLLGLPESPGMIGLLRGECGMEQAVQSVGEHGLHVIQAGGRANNQAVQLLTGERTAPLIAQLRQMYDHVIIDTPPVIELADAGVLGALSDEVLLIARLYRTPRSLVEQAIKTLHSYNAPVAGVIATDQQRSRRRYYYRYGYSHRNAVEHRQAA